jgi:hypothetical protein
MAEPHLWGQQLHSQSQPQPHAQAQPQSGPQLPPGIQLQRGPQFQVRPPIPLLPTDNSTYTFIARLTTHIFRAPDFPIAPRVLVFRNTDPIALFSCCILSDNDDGPTVLMEAQHGSSREEAMGKVLGLLEERGARQVRRAEGCDRARRDVEVQVIRGGPVRR